MKTIPLAIFTRIRDVSGLDMYDIAVSTADQIMFAHVVDRADEDIELDVAALLVGEAEAEGGLDIARYLAKLDAFAAAALRSVSSGDDPFGEIRAINRVLFGEMGFRGNEDNYHDPKNSFLHEVIERRIGIPISLSIVYMEVARRMGVDVQGLCFPGHFLVRHDQADTCLIIDPFYMGLILDPGQLLERLRRAQGREAVLRPEMLQPANKRQILARLLTNLVEIYQRQGDLARSIAVLERMQILTPDDSSIRRELDRLHARISELN